MVFLTGGLRLVNLNLKIILFVSSPGFSLLFYTRIQQPVWRTPCFLKGSLRRFEASFLQSFFLFFAHQRKVGRSQPWFWKASGCLLLISWIFCVFCYTWIQWQQSVWHSTQLDSNQLYKMWLVFPPLIFLPNLHFNNKTGFVANN